MLLILSHLDSFFAFFPWRLKSVANLEILNYKNSFAIATMSCKGILMIVQIAKDSMK
jgi:hypothetical protein